MKVRTTITLDAETMDVLDEYADVLGLSRSSVINGMIEESIPTLKKVVSEFKAFLESTNGNLNQKDLDKLKSRIFLHLARQINEVED